MKAGVPHSVMIDLFAFLIMAQIVDTDVQLCADYEAIV